MTNGAHNWFSQKAIDKPQVSLGPDAVNLVERLALASFGRH